MTDRAETPRRWTGETGKGRVDIDGVVWFACDPYPCWYRWEDDVLIQPDYPLTFKDQEP